MDDLTKNEEILLQFKQNDSDLKVILEDDGRVAYAYLLKANEIVSDVWLYNVSETPIFVNWKDTENMPFLNPMKYCISEKFERLLQTSKVLCEWIENGVKIYFNNDLIAILQFGMKPAWSKYAIVKGPLAIPLEEKNNDK